MKTLTTSLIRLSIYDLRREDMLTPGRVVTWHRSRQGKVFASLRFVVAEDRLTICDSDRRPLYDIKLSKTAVYLGGTRPWLHYCPRCGRRLCHALQRRRECLCLPPVSPSGLSIAELIRRLEVAASGTKDPEKVRVAWAGGDKAAMDARIHLSAASRTPQRL